MPARAVVLVNLVVVAAVVFAVLFVSALRRDVVSVSFVLLLMLLVLLPVWSFQRLICC